MMPYSQHSHAHPSMSSTSSSSMGINSILNSSAFVSQSQQPYPMSRAQSRFAASMAFQTTTSNPDPNANPTNPFQGAAGQGLDLQSQLQGHTHGHPAPGTYMGRTYAQMHDQPVPGSYQRQYPQMPGQAFQYQGYPPQFGAISRPESRASTAPSHATTSTSRSKVTTAPLGPSNLDPVALSRLSQPQSALPAALATALNLANPGFKLPSVLEPKMTMVEFSLPDAIAYLLSTLDSNSPTQNAVLNGEQLLRDRAVDVTFYDPSGTYLIPVRELILRNTTSLAALVLELQTLLDQNIFDMNRMSKSRELKRYLVYSVQVRIYSTAAFESFPKIRGNLGGADENNGAEYVQWSCDHGEMELYWDTYRRVVQLGAVSNGVQTITKPMFKVRTVLKLPSDFDSIMIGGGHVFMTSPIPLQQSVREPTLVVQEKPKKNKTASDLNEDDQAILATVLNVFASKQNKGDASKVDLVAAVSNVYNVREAAKMEDKNSQGYRDKMQQAFIFKMYKKQNDDFRKQNGLPLVEKPLDPKRNWGYYQRMGGNPEIHKAFDLSKSKAPFDEADTPPPGFYDHLHDPSTIPTAEDMVPYMEIDPAVYRVQNLSPADQMRLKKHYEGQELAVGFEDDDDEIFFPEATRDTKSRSASPAPALASPTPMKHAKKNLRLDVESILNSVNSRKNINAPFQNAAGLNRPMSPSPLQNMTTANDGTASFGMGGTSFASFNNMASATQSGGPSFYDNSYGTAETQGTGYENMLNTSSNQAANFYESMVDPAMSQNAYNMGMNTAANQARFRNNNAGTNPGNAKFKGMGKQPVASLSSFNDMLMAKNPTMGTLSSFASGNQFGNSGTNSPYVQAATLNSAGTPTANPSLATYHALKAARGGGNRPPLSRARVGSQLRGESPAFEMSSANENRRRAPAGSPSARLGSRPVAGLQKMTMEDSTDQISKFNPNSSFESK